MTKFSDVLREAVRDIKQAAFGPVVILASGEQVCSWTEAQQTDLSTATHCSIVGALIRHGIHTSTYGTYMNILEYLDFRGYTFDEAIAYVDEQDWRIK